MRYEPHEYQRYATRYIEEHPCSAVLLDMGLGKTSITLTAIADLLFDSFEVHKVLVIAPLRVARDTWSAELIKWDELYHLTYSVAVGTASERKAALMRKADIYLINRENVQWLIEKSKLPFDYDMVVVDELSSFKNHQSKRFKALMQVRPRIKRIVGLTGTPASNGLMDLWAEFKVIDMGKRLGRFITGYRQEYFVPDAMNGQIVYSYRPKPGAEAAIYQQISDITISMKSTDHLKMPELISNAYKVYLSPDERETYDEMKKQFVLDLPDGEITAANAAALSGKLSQLANGAIYDDTGSVVPIHDRKLDALEDIIESANGKPLLVAYWYQHDLERIAKRLHERHMCPALNRRVKILTATKRIVYLPTNSFYQVLSAEAYSKHGFNIHGVVFDELHTQPNRKLFDVMTKGSGDARMQPLYFLITTAGTDTKSICYETHQKAKDLLEGRKIDPTFYPVIYGADENDDWTDPKVWKKANPSLGITVGIDKVKAACESAKQNPAEENAFRQLRLNQWVKQAVRWMPMEKWDRCAFAVNEDDLEGRVCYGGLDLSSTTDITAFVLVFPPLDEEDKFVILPYFWIPEENMDQRVNRDHVPYDVWERQGYLQTTEGNVIHYGYIEKFIERLGERFNIREIAFDRWGAVQMVQNLEGMGFTVVPFGQGFKDMSPPTKELMKLVLEQRIAHAGHPVLRWMMDNIYVRTDPAGNIKPDKEKSTEKIDGAVATIMALDRAIRCGNDTGESVYDSRGLLFI